MHQAQSGKRYVQRGDGLPEIGWHNPKVGYLIEEEMMGFILADMAVMISRVLCTEDWCERCNPTRKLWWTLYNESSTELRLAIAESLSEHAVALPPGYYDETPLP